MFDASCVYGHNEAEWVSRKHLLGSSGLLKFHSLIAPRLFEGMPKSFFDAYHQHMPKTEPVGQYELRRDLYEVFHYLNHTVLFGVSTWVIDANRCSHTTQERYASCAERKMERLLIALA